MLLRRKHGEDTQARLHKVLTSSPVFHLLRDNIVLGKVSRPPTANCQLQPVLLCNGLCRGCLTATWPVSRHQINPSTHTAAPMPPLPLAAALPLLLPLPCCGNNRWLASQVT